MADPDITSTIERWIPRGSEVALLDVPVHRNVGDMFILAAGARLLEDLGCRVIYHAGLWPPEARSRGRCTRGGAGMPSARFAGAFVQA